MNTPVSDRAMNAARKVLALCAAHDPWFPEASDSTLFAWAYQISLTSLSEEDLLAGVVAAYKSHGDGFKPLPAAVISAARVIVQDRMAKAHEPVTTVPATPEARAAALHTIAATLARSKHGPHSAADPAGEDHLPHVNVLLVGCPVKSCRAAVGEHCSVELRGGARARLTKIAGHPARIEAAAIAMGFDLDSAAEIATEMLARAASSHAGGRKGVQ